MQKEKMTLRMNAAQDDVCAAISSVDNFRDLGGYRTVCGRRVRHGCFYRAAALGRITENDKGLLERVGIRTVFDFRSTGEVRAEPDILPEGAAYWNHSGITTMDERQVNFDMKTLLREMSENPAKIAAVHDFLIDGYRTMALSSGAFAKLFEAIKTEERMPVLFHCTAGKDRTGIGAAFILLALGVPEATVIEDYFLSNRYRESANRRILQGAAQSVADPAVLEGIRGLLEVRACYIRTTLDTIEERYGGFDAFLAQELKVSPDERAILQERYLLAE